MVSIRNYTPADFPMISTWWAAANEPGPNELMLPPESTFIAEIDGIAVLTVSLYLTNIRQFCYVENFCGNPEFKGPARREACQYLLKYIETFARALGYKSLYGMSYRGPVKKRYEQLGFIPTVNDVTTFIRIL